LEKERFLDLARNYTSLTEAETKDLDALQKQFPYSQVIHNLASRGAQDHQLKTSKTLLNISAVYSTDRSVLKDIITAPRTERASPPPVEQKVVETPIAVVIDEKPVVERPVVEKVVKEKPVETVVVDATPPAITEPVILVGAADGLSGEALNDEIMTDLNRLKELKHDFEVSVEAFEHSKHASPAKEVRSKQEKPPAKVTPKEPTVQKKKDEALDVIPEPSGEVLLEEIKTTKKKITPESPKQKEQIEIIDQFIKKRPSIAKITPAAATDASDLAEKNLSLIDNLVSETLVEILLRQGKKDKAIEVLKKLIWKFPQKKAIFAAQIDELKK
jgi:hypothetical protein